MALLFPFYDLVCSAILCSWRSTSFSLLLIIVDLVHNGIYTYAKDIIIIKLFATEKTLSGL